MFCNKKTIPMNIDDKNFVINKIRKMVNLRKPKICNFTRYNNNDLHKNQYLLTFKTNGANFLLFLTTIYGKQYSFFIHYDNLQNIQIYNVKLRFNYELYYDTIIDGELLLDNKMNWVFMLNNILYLKGENMNRYLMGQKINILSDILRKQYKFDDFLNHCHLQLRSYFLFNHLEMLSNTHNNQLLLIPEKSHNSILSFNIKNLDKNQKIITTLSLNPNNIKSASFFVQKTDVPDVFELYDDTYLGKYQDIKEQNKLKEKLFHGIACIPSKSHSFYIKKLFDEIEHQKGIWINFVYNYHLKGWEPEI